MKGGVAGTGGRISCHGDAHDLYFEVLYLNCLENTSEAGLYNLIINCLFLQGGSSGIEKSMDIANRPGFKHSPT